MKRKKEYPLKNIQKILYYLSLIVWGFLMCFILGDDGPILLKDSQFYLSSSMENAGGYRLYVFFLSVCRNIFGETYFLNAVWIIQSVLAIAVSFCFTNYIKTKYRLGYLEGIIIYGLCFLPYLYSYPNEVVTHHIMTEALAIPFMMLIVLFILKYLEVQKKYFIFMAFIFSLIVTNVRPALAFMCVGVLVIFLFEKVKCYFTNVKRHAKRTIIFVIVLGFILGLISSIYFIRISVEKNLWTQLTQAVAGRTLCAIEYQDRKLFSGEYKEVYDFIYKNIDEKRTRVEYFSKGVWRSEEIAYSSNENTKMYFKLVKFFYEEHSDYLANRDEEQVILETSTYIVGKLFSYHIWDYVKMTIQLLPYSLVASIFVQPDSYKEICYLITALIYGFTFMVLIYGFHNRILFKYISPMLVTLFFLLLNVVFVNLIFYGQQRYVIYMFGLFYISWVILMRGMLNTYVRHRKNSN